MRVPGEALVYRYARLFADQLGYDTARLADPELVGPIAARPLRLAVLALASLSVASSVTAAITVFFSPLHGAALMLAGLALLGLYHALPHIWRSVLASGVEQELPAVLVYLVPYSASPRYIADVIAGLPEGVFRWFRHESARLRLLLDMGLDPLTALRRLAETTPSRRLREVLVEYTSLQLLGSQSSEASIRLLDRAVALVREKWASYRETGRAVVELSASGLVSLVALGPMLGEAVGAAALGMGLIMGVAGVMLLLSRPRLGDTPASPIGPPLFLGGVSTASVLALTGHPKLSAAVLALAAIAGEALHARSIRIMRRALRSLRVAAEKARLGLDYTADLAGALPLGAPIRAVLESSRIAGSIGVGQALLRLLRVVEEASEHRRRASMEGAVLEAVSMAAPLVMAIAIRRLQELFQGASQLGLAGPSIGLEAILALAPLAVVPAAILRRGRTASTLSALGAMLLVTILG